MSSTAPTPVLREWIRPAPTTKKLDYAKLAQIDISKWFDPHQRASLLEDIRHAVHDVGFWFVTGHGIDDVEIRRQLAIGEAFLDLPLEEKRKHPCDFKNGNFFGFREGTRTIGDTEVKDNSEALNLPKITPVLAHELPKFDFILVRRLSPHLLHQLLSSDDNALQRHSRMRSAHSRRKCTRGS